MLGQNFRHLCDLCKSVSAVESYLANSDGQLGVTGEGTLLENAEGRKSDLCIALNRSFEVS